MKMFHVPDLDWFLTPSAITLWRACTRDVSAAVSVISLRVTAGWSLMYRSTQITSSQPTRGQLTSVPETRNSSDRERPLNTMVRWVAHFQERPSQPRRCWAPKIADYRLQFKIVIRRPLRAAHLLPLRHVGGADSSSVVSRVHEAPWPRSSRHACFQRARKFREIVPTRPGCCRVQLGADGPLARLTTRGSRRMGSSLGQFGGILADRPAIAFSNAVAGEPSLVVRDVLTAMISARDPGRDRAREHFHNPGPVSDPSRAREVASNGCRGQSLGLFERRDRLLASHWAWWWPVSFAPVPPRPTNGARARVGRRRDAT